MENYSVDGYDTVARCLKEKLDLTRSPVAIKFVLQEKDLPDNIKEIELPIRHCEMVTRASDGETFYAIATDQACKGGAAAIGADKTPENLKTGEFYYDLGRFSSIGAAKRTINAIPKINMDIHATIYAPLEKARFHPDVIIVIANPVQAMKLSQALIYTLGGRLEADFSGIQSLCADAVAGPFMRKVPNITLGCSGSRKFAGIEDQELIVGLNGENIGCVINALDEMS